MRVTAGKYEQNQERATGYTVTKYEQQNECILINYVQYLQVQIGEKVIEGVEVIN